MSEREHYNSLCERISWTTGFRCLTDKHVLEMLATFANFGRYKDDPKMGQVRRDLELDWLIKRAKLPRRTVIRSLRRLEAGGWIRARRQHRHHTAYDITIEKLSPHWMEAKLVQDLSATGGTQTSDLSATGGTQFTNSLSATGDRLSATDGTQAPDLGATGGTLRSPVRTDPPDPQSAPARRAGVLPNDRRRTGTLFAIGQAKVERDSAGVGFWDAHRAQHTEAADGECPSARTADVLADEKDRQRGNSTDAAIGFWGAHRAHQAAASRAGVSSPPRSDSPSAPSPDRSGARVGPQQKAFGPLADVNAPLAVTPPATTHWQRLADTIRTGLLDKERAKKSG